MSSGSRVLPKKILLAIKPSIRSSTRKTRGWYTLLALQATAFSSGGAFPERGKAQGWHRYESPFRGDLLLWVREPQSEFGKGHRPSIMMRRVGAVVHLYCGRGDCRQDF
jgi:hypothetical protein